VTLHAGSKKAAYCAALAPTAPDLMPGATSIEKNDINENINDHPAPHLARSGTYPVRTQLHSAAPVFAGVVASRAFGPLHQ
jgi:hypothetical protein